MKLYALALLAVLSLSACGSEKPGAPASESAAAAELPLPGPEIRILAFGDSLFAGYGLNPGESYPAKLEAALRSRGINARIANAGVSGDTTTGALARLDFTLKSQNPPPVTVLISLGGNDMLRGLPPAQTRANLEAIVAAFSQRGMKVVLMGMLAPPNLGADYRKAFDAIYPDLTRQYRAELVPFFLQAVMDKPDLVQADHLHPTAQGIEEIVAATRGTVAEALPPVLVRSKWETSR